MIERRAGVVFHKLAVMPSRKTARSEVAGSLKTQAAKTYRNLSRIPRLVAKYASAVLRWTVAARLRGQSTASSPSAIEATLPSERPATPETADAQAIFQSGIRALNDVRIADAVSFLRQAATMDSWKTDVTDLWLRHEACKNLGVALHHGLGRLDEAIGCWRETVRLARLIRETCESAAPVETEIYDPFWVNHIGHTAILGILAKRDLLTGQPDKKRYLIRSAEHNIGNPYLVEQMGRFFTLVDDPAAHFQFPIQFAPAFCKFFWIDNRLSGPSTYAWQVLAEISRAWEENKGGPLLSFSPGEFDSNQKKRAALGVPPNAWHVCLHVRDSGFKHFHDDLHATLNADIRTYDLAIAAVVRRGGWVIRMGDPSMPALPAARNVIDYAHNPQKSAEMEIYLCATSRFFIGTSSGPSLVPALYGLPSVITNWFPTGTRPLNSNDLFIPKLHWYEREEEFAPFDESMSQPLGHMHATPVLANLGISLQPNLREELADVVEEMLDRLDGGTDYNEEDHQLQSYFETVALQSRSYGNARIGRNFLRKYQALLPQTLLGR